MFIRLKEVTSTILAASIMFTLGMTSCARPKTYNNVVWAFSFRSEHGWQQSFLIEEEGRLVWKRQNQNLGNIESRKAPEKIHDILSIFLLPGEDISGVSSEYLGGCETHSWPKRITCWAERSLVWNVRGVQVHGRVIVAATTAISGAELVTTVRRSFRLERDFLSALLDEKPEQTIRDAAVAARNILTELDFNEGAENFVTSLARELEAQEEAQQDDCDRRVR